ncbi:hypothetical protein [Streptomyces kaniharaensis]|uniref:hypothetical protein n=1 Tax=Streptomyces kaniharaensis TaxID=212423 RepID=UPI00389A2879
MVPIAGWPSAARAAAEAWSQAFGSSSGRPGRWCSHLGGALGAALCRAALDRAWVERIGSGRALRVTPDGGRALRELLGVETP